MAQSKMEDFVRLLLQHTQEGKIVWEETARAGVFQTAFPEYVVTIEELIPPREVAKGTVPSDFPGLYSLRIRDAQGRTVEETAPNFKRPGPELAWLLVDLYKTVRLQGTSGEQALDTLLSRLKALG